MRTFWALALCMACAAMGQISSMATDYAGQRLLFATTLSQSGSSQPNYGKLFTADWQGVNPLLIYNRDILSTTGLYGNPGLLTNYYDVVATDISSNGAYISVAALNECSGYTKGLCGSGYQSTLYDTHGQVALIARGQVILSRNGTWAMAVDPPTEGGTVFTLYDITAATKFPVGEYLAAFSGAWQHAVANNGTAVVATQDGLLIFEPASTMQMVQGTFQMWVQSAVVDPAGTVAVWEQIDDYPVGNSSLHAVRTADLSKTMNLTASGLSDFRPHISDDGSTLLFLSTSIGEPFGAHTQASIMAIDGSGRHPVTNEPDGIVDAVLSGNGQVVWALTGTGRLLKVDLGGGETQYIPATAAWLQARYWLDFHGAQIVGDSAVASPGSASFFQASVMPGERVEVAINGQTVPIISVLPQTVVVQVPWGISLNSVGTTDTVTITKPDSTSWSGDQMQIGINAMSPLILTSVHQDFSSVVTTSVPAHAGEILHLYGTGFGPVSPPVPDGVAAPSAPLSFTVNPVVCEATGENYGNIGTPEVLYSGLAPGTIGFYQLDVRLPNPLSSGNYVNLTCNRAYVQVPSEPGS